MSYNKDEMICKAIDEWRMLEFVFKKDGSLRTVEPYTYYYDTNGKLKVWAYQPKKSTGSGGPRVFFVEDMTYMRLGEEFDPRDMALAPMLETTINTSV